MDRLERAFSSSPPVDVPLDARVAHLAGRRFLLPGPGPRVGDRLAARFSIPAARHATAPLRGDDIERGFVVVSTLPNIEKHACIAQIVDLEERAVCLAHVPRIFHVSADAARHWVEVDFFHRTIAAPGYSLAGADDESRRSFTRAFGVEVAGERRIAHGLFALWRGEFLAIDIPVDQMLTPAVVDFLDRAHALLHGIPR
jgi:hypothetical protein